MGHVLRRRGIQPCRLGGLPQHPSQEVIVAREGIRRLPCQLGAFALAGLQSDAAQ